MTSNNNIINPCVLEKNINNTFLKGLILVKNGLISGYNNETVNLLKKLSYDITTGTSLVKVLKSLGHPEIDIAELNEWLVDPERAAIDFEILIREPNIHENIHCYYQKYNIPRQISKT